MIKNMNILNSASKIVFIIMAVAVIGLTFVGIVEPKDFIVLASMCFAFYFTKSPTPSVSTTTNDTATVSTGVVEK